MIQLPEGTPTRQVFLGGRPRTIAFTMGALRRLRERLGDKAEEIQANPGLMMEYIDRYLWAMLVDPEDRAEIAPNALADMIPLGKLGDYVGPVTELVLESIGSQEEAGEEANPPAGKKKVPRKR